MAKCLDLAQNEVKELKKTIANKEEQISSLITEK